jgi:hypothetical protein
MNGSPDAGEPFADIVPRYADMLVRVGYTYLKNIHDAERYRSGSLPEAY